MKARNVKPQTLAVLALSAVPLMAAGDEQKPANLVCSSQPVICVSFATGANGRFDPLVQQLLAKQQLDGQPKAWSVIYLYVPGTDTRALEELQIRFLDELLARSRATEQKGTSP